MSHLAGVYAGARPRPLKGVGKIKYLPTPLFFWRVEFWRGLYPSVWSLIWNPLLLFVSEVGSNKNQNFAVEGGPR